MDISDYSARRDEILAQEQEAWKNGGLYDIDIVGLELEALDREFYGVQKLKEPTRFENFAKGVGNYILGGLALAGLALTGAAKDMTGEVYISIDENSIVIDYYEGATTEVNPETDIKLTEKHFRNFTDNYTSIEDILLSGNDSELSVNGVSLNEFVKYDLNEDNRARVYLWDRDGNDMRIVGVDIEKKINSVEDIIELDKMLEHLGFNNTSAPNSEFYIPKPHNFSGFGYHAVHGIVSELDADTKVFNIKYSWRQPAESAINMLQKLQTSGEELGIKDQASVTSNDRITNMFYFTDNHTSIEDTQFVRYQHLPNNNSVENGELEQFLSKKYESRLSKNDIKLPDLIDFEEYASDKRLVESESLEYILEGIGEYLSERYEYNDDKFVCRHYTDNFLRLFDELRAVNPTLELVRVDYARYQMNEFEGHAIPVIYSTDGTNLFASFVDPTWSDNPRKGFKEYKFDAIDDRHRIYIG